MRRPTRAEVVALVALLLITLYLIPKGWIMKTLLRLLALLGAAFLALVLLVALFGGSSDRTADPPGSPATTATTPTPAAPSTADAAPASVGTEVRDGAFAFVVTDVQAGVPTVGQGIVAETAQGAYTIVTVVVTNVGRESQMFDGSSQKVRDAAGREFSYDSRAAMSVPGSNSFLESINPGNAVTATLIYDLPTGAEATVIDLHDSPFSEGVVISLQG